MEQAVTTQKKAIREHLLGGGTITSLEALRLFGCFRLASRISDLRSEGMNIEKTMVAGVSAVTGKPTRFAQYRLAPDKTEKATPEA